MLMHALGHSGHDAHAAPTSHNESLLAILQRRYALGELTREQFEEAKRVLGIAESTAEAQAAAHPGHHQG